MLVKYKVYARTPSLVGLDRDEIEETIDAMQEEVYWLGKAAELAEEYGYDCEELTEREAEGDGWITTLLIHIDGECASSPGFDKELTKWGITWETEGEEERVSEPTIEDIDPEQIMGVLDRMIYQHAFDHALSSAVDHGSDKTREKRDEVNSVVTFSYNLVNSLHLPYDFSTAERRGSEEGKDYYYRRHAG